MSDLSVTDVQEHLRHLAAGGHDIISRPGGLTLQGRNYPMAYAHGLELHTNFHRGYSIFPLNESGNVAFVYSSNENNKAISRTNSVNVMHPATYSSKGGKHWYETTFSVHDDVDWYGEDTGYGSSHHDIHEALDKMKNIKGQYWIVNHPNSVQDYARLKEHDPAEAAWNTVTNNMRFGYKEWVPHPKELDLRRLGSVVHVYDAKSDTSHLYHPESEKLIKL